MREPSEETNMGMRVLITGGAGFLGRRLGATLSSRYSVVLGDVVPTEVAGCTFVQLDVANVDEVRKVFGEVKPDIVVHAAANKYVDLSEKDPFHCVDVNITGTESIARVAMETGVPMVVGLSSTAATPPQVSVYGLAKAILERTFCSLNGKTETKFTTVRLGNIPWSTGSVLPAWKEMLAKGGVVTTTGPDDHRFFCRLEEAVETVQIAIDNIDEVAGKVLVRKSKQARIQDVLDAFVKANGGTVQKAEARLTGRSIEILVGDLEVPYTRETVLGGAPHFVISFNAKANPPIAGMLDAANADALSGAELSAIVAAGA